MAEYKCTRIAPYSDDYIQHWGVKGMKWDPKLRKYTDADYDENGNLIDKIKGYASTIKGRVYNELYADEKAKNRDSYIQNRNAQKYAEAGQKNWNDIPDIEKQKYLDSDNYSGYGKLAAGVQNVGTALTNAGIGAANAINDVKNLGGSISTGFNNAINAIGNSGKLLEAQDYERNGKAAEEYDNDQWKGVSRNKWKEFLTGAKYVGSDAWNKIKSAGSKVKEAYNNLKAKAKLNKEAEEYIKEHPGTSKEDAKTIIGNKRATEALKNTKEYNETAANMERINKEAQQRQQIKDEQEAQKKASAAAEAKRKADLDPANLPEATKKLWEENSKAEQEKRDAANSQKAHHETNAEGMHEVKVDGQVYKLNDADYEEYSKLTTPVEKRKFLGIYHSDDVRDAIQHSWYDYCEEGHSCVVLCHRG